MKSRFTYILLLLLTAVHYACHAQRMDYPTLEALIADHKTIVGPIKKRGTLEFLNKELHDNAREEVLDYKDVNEQLDKYTRCFEILDIVYNSLSVSMNIYNTTVDIREKLVSIANLLDRYRTCVIMRQLGRTEDIGRYLNGMLDISSVSGTPEWRQASDLFLSGTGIVPQDTVIFTIGRDMVKDVGEKAEDIYHSFVTLVGYATGVMACTTEGLLKTIQGLNDQITELRKIVDHGHFLLWRYIHMRTGYWTTGVLRQHKSIGEHAREALERWHRATYGKFGIGS